MTIGDLIQQKHCTAACVAAITSPGRCRCPCSGEFHGLLGSAHIDGLIEARRAGLNRLTDLEVISA